MKSGIYKITNPKGRVYIGSSKNIKSRIMDYKILKCKGQTVIYNSLLKYGVDEHFFDVVEYCDESLLLERERHYGLLYDVLNKHKGLNCHIPLNGEGRVVFSEECRKRRSVKIKGEGNPFFGKSHSKETKELISIASKNRIPHNKGKRGYKLTDEAKMNMSKAHTGRKHSQDTILKMKNNGRPPRMVLHLDTGIYFDSSKEAAAAFSVPYKRLVKRISSLKKYTNMIYI